MGHEAGAIRHCTIQVQQAAVWRLERIDVMCRQEGGGAVRLDLQGMKGRQAGGRGQGQRAGGEVQWMGAGIQDRTGRGGQAGRVGSIVAGLQCQPMARQTSGSAHDPHRLTLPPSSGTTCSRLPCSGLQSKTM